MCCFRCELGVQYQAQRNTCDGGVNAGEQHEAPERQTEKPDVANEGCKRSEECRRDRRPCPQHEAAAAARQQEPDGGALPLGDPAAAGLHDLADLADELREPMSWT